MKPIHAIAAVFTAAVLILFLLPGPAANDRRVKAITDVRLFDGTSVTENATLLISEGRVIESGAGIEVPERGQYYRVILGELSRMSDHLTCNGASAMELGAYGYLHSVEVQEILGPDEMIVTEPWLIDPDRLDEQFKQEERRLKQLDATRADLEELEARWAQRRALEEQQRQREFRQPMRLKGFATDGLEAGKRWLGPEGRGLQVALVKQENIGSDQRPRFRMVATPADRFGDGLTQQQFVDLLAERGMDIAAFTDLVREMRREDPLESNQLIFEALLPDVAERE